ncbi:hydrogenase maturation protease [Desulfitibacter alkalitolerans]|uniref:hydrogenase maturation protease n=1 Tax=Desulfitibacter alkalitolerans TaxID=264641 RepID=UPI0004849B56|nr:hydrogenase maturation protease [Desulfitibacter alkalitolerans]
MTAIMGYGNELMEDDWIGLFIVESLKESALFPWEIIHGGTPGFNVLWDLLGREKLIIIDSVLSENTPGKIFKISSQELLDNINMNGLNYSSSHGINWQEVIAIGMSQYPDLFPKEITFLLIEIVSVNLAYKTFSPAIDSCKHSIAKKIEQEILLILKEQQEISRN